MMRHEKTQEIVTHPPYNRNCLWKGPEGVTKTQKLQSSYYKYVHKLKGNNVLRNKGKYDDNISLNRKNQ